MTEQAVVDEHASKYYGAAMQGVDRRINQFAVEALAPRITGPSLLEMGCGDGVWTEVLAGCVERLTVVDGSQELLDALTGRLGSGIRTHCSLFEDLDFNERFDQVVCAHVLEHVEDPLAVLRTARRHLRPGGSGLFVVPNAESLHRKVGVALGALGHLTDLSPSDQFIGHRRVYTLEKLVSDIMAAGFEVMDEGGVFLKPLSNAQMEGWSDDLLRAFYRVGQEVPFLCVQIWVEARRA